MKLALKQWVVLGSAPPLTPPHLPHNSLYVISDEGKLVTRYDKRMASYIALNRNFPLFFTADVIKIQLLLAKSDVEVGWKYELV